MAYIEFDDIPLAHATPVVKRSQRRQQANFGDGYSQLLTDGLNTDREIWQCLTSPMPNADAYSVESYLLTVRGSAIEWTAPMSTKTFSRPFESGVLDLGYTDLSALSLAGYTRPTNYTANLDTGLLTSVDIANDTVVEVTLTLSPRDYVLRDGWTMTPVSASFMTISFELERVFV